MRNRFSTALIASAATCAVVWLSGVGTTGQAARQARTPDNHPNFNGIWMAMSGANWDLLAHEMRPIVPAPGVYPDVPMLGAPVVALGSLGGIPASPGVVDGNVIPYKPEAAAKKKQFAERFLDRDPEVRCYMPGIPRAMYMPYPFSITQSPTRIQMVFAYANASHAIHLQPVDAPPADTWMGHSVGKWEGNTLVTTVTNFNDRTWFSRSGDFHSDKLKVTERYTIVDASHMNYEATIDDPETFTRPWKIKMPLYRRIEPNAQLLEFKCVEFVEELMYGHLRKRSQ